MSDETLRKTGWWIAGCSLFMALLNIYIGLSHSRPFNLFAAAIGFIGGVFCLAALWSTRD